MRRAAFVLGVVGLVMLGCGEDAPSKTNASAGSAGSTPASSAPGNGGNAGMSSVAGGAGRTSGGAAGAGGASAGSGPGGSKSDAGSRGSPGGAGAGAAAGSGGTAGASAGTLSAGGTETGGAPGGAGSGGEANGQLGVLVFSKTERYRHASIPDAIAAFATLAVERGWGLMATEDPAVFTDETLENVDVVVFLSTTGEVVGDEQQAAFERFIRRGGGYVGIHSAADTEYDWEFYGELVGAYFREHPAIQEATLHADDPGHPLMQGIPTEWTRTDEWYAFQANPRANVHVLMSLDESSYEPGSSAMDGDHPSTWLHEYEGGRAFYTALGHTEESYEDPEFLGLLAGAVEWAGGR